MCLTRSGRCEGAGPGPEVWIGWRDAITLAGENVPADATGQGSEGRRYRRRVDALIEAGYTAGAGRARRRGGDGVGPGAAVRRGAILGGRGGGA